MRRFLTLCLAWVFTPALAIAPAPADAAEPVTFESAVFTLSYSPFRMRMAKKKGIKLAPKTYPAHRLAGTLSTPAGPGPFPAVVLMHGCAGIDEWNAQWTPRLVGWGYAVLDVDSFTPRGYTYICDAREGEAATPWTRALDAFGAKSFLAARPGIDPNRIAVMGMSHGGGAVLHAIEAAMLEGTKQATFQAAVAFYPLCREMQAPVTPALILIGDADMWTPADWCRRYVAAVATPHEVTLKVFTGAHHLFDVDGMDGADMGLTLRHDPAAAAEAIGLVKGFLRARLR